MRPFLFHDESTGINHYLEIIETPGIETDDDMIEFFDAHMCDSAEMEYLERHFGIHDISYDYDVMFGFTSYEWEDIEGLKKYWSKWLTDLGFTVGEWYE